MRFLADMGVDQRVVDGLRAQGHDAVHLREQGLQRSPDAAVFAYGNGPIANFSGRFSRALPGPRVLPGSNAHVVPPFGGFPLAHPVSKTARVVRPC